MCTSQMGSGARSSLLGRKGPWGGQRTGSLVFLQLSLHFVNPTFHFVTPPSSALYASRLYLSQYQLTHPERLAKHSPEGPWIRGILSS